MLAAIILEVKARFIKKLMKIRKATYLQWSWTEGENYHCWLNTKTNKSYEKQMVRCFSIYHGLVGAKKSCNPQQSNSFFKKKNKGLELPRSPNNKDSSKLLSIIESFILQYW
uniref:Uncharacterized protein n=1 Tax=Micrurus surinamensis TaxID=129470 RepID=A0A2D4P8L7_MICSU